MHSCCRYHTLFFHDIPVCVGFRSKSSCESCASVILEVILGQSVVIPSLQSTDDVKIDLRPKRSRNHCLFLSEVPVVRGEIVSDNVTLGRYFKSYSFNDWGFCDLLLCIFPFFFWAGSIFAIIFRFCAGVDLFILPLDLFRDFIFAFPLPSASFSLDLSPATTFLEDDAPAPPPSEIQTLPTPNASRNHYLFLPDSPLLFGSRALYSTWSCAIVISFILLYCRCILVVSGFWKINSA